MKQSHAQALEGRKWPVRGQAPRIRTDRCRRYDIDELPVAWPRTGHLRPSRGGFERNEIASGEPVCDAKMDERKLARRFLDLLANSNGIPLHEAGEIPD